MASVFGNMFLNSKCHLLLRAAMRQKGIQNHPASPVVLDRGWAKKVSRNTVSSRLFEMVIGQNHIQKERVSFVVVDCDSTDKVSNSNRCPVVVDGDMLFAKCVSGSNFFRFRSGLVPDKFHLLLYIAIRQRRFPIWCLLCFRGQLCTKDVKKHSVSSVVLDGD